MMLTSKNLILRRLQKTDAEDFFDVMGNKKVMNPIPLSVLSKKESDAHLIELIVNKDIEIFAVTTKQEEVFLGIIAMVRDNEILYRIRPKYWGQGYASEAVSIFISYIFQNLKKNYITAEANETNIASIKILSKFMERKEKYFSKKLNCYHIKFKKLALS